MSVGGNFLANFFHGEAVFVGMFEFLKTDIFRFYPGKIPGNPTEHFSIVKTQPMQD